MKLECLRFPGSGGTLDPLSSLSSIYVELPEAGV